MKRLLILLLLVVPGALLAQQDLEPLFWQQIRQTCGGGQPLRWEKTVEAPAENVSESHLFQVDCLRGTIHTNEADGPAPPISEFDFLFEYNAANNFQREYFDFEEANGGWTALRKESASGDTPLEKQVFEVDASGTLRHAAAHIVKENALYTLKIEIEVWFDASGRYLRHQTHTFTQPLLKEGVRTRITAQLLP